MHLPSHALLEGGFPSDHPVVVVVVVVVVVAAVEAEADLEEV